jgi:hypothetical protein
MRFDWQQLSPRERQVLVRHVLFRPNSGAPVTPERVCAVMQKTHQLTCYTTKDGKAVIEFVTKRGEGTAVSTAETFTEGIFKAALRAKGVDVEDGSTAQSARIAPRSRRILTHA